MDIARYRVAWLIASLNRWCKQVGERRLGTSLVMRRGLPLFAAIPGSTCCCGPSSVEDAAVEQGQALFIML